MVDMQKTWEMMQLFGTMNGTVIVDGPGIPNSLITMIYYERPKVNNHQSRRSRENGKAPHPLSHGTLPEEWSKNSFVVFDHLLTNFTYSHTETEPLGVAWPDIQGDRRHERPKARAHNVSPHTSDNIDLLFE